MIRAPLTICTAGVCSEGNPPLPHHHPPNESYTIQTISLLSPRQRCWVFCSVMWRGWTRIMCRMTQGSGLETAYRLEANYRLPCGSLAFPRITATGLGARPALLLSEREIKKRQHMEAAKQWFIFMIFDEWFLI